MSGPTPSEADPADPAAGRAVADILGLAPLAGEGGFVRRTYDGAELSCALYAVVSPDFSALHTLASTEVYHWLGGAPLRLVLLRPGGIVERVLLGPAPQHSSQAVVPPGVWQGANTAGGWSLVGLTVVPPFAPERFRLADPVRLRAGWPDASEDIAALTRTPPPQGL